jgi:hypothetical protein
MHEREEKLIGDLLEKTRAGLIEWAGYGTPSAPHLWQKYQMVLPNGMRLLLEMNDGVPSRFTHLSTFRKDDSLEEVVNTISAAGNSLFAEVSRRVEKQFLAPHDEMVEMVIAAVRKIGD